MATYMNFKKIFKNTAKVAKVDANVDVKEPKATTEKLVYSDDHRDVSLVRLTKKDQCKYGNWKKNRPADVVRIKEISEYYERNKINMVPGMVHGYIEDDITYIYDGIHRVMAAFEQEHEMNMFLCMLKNWNEDNVLNDFLNINKSVSVPAIYMEEGNMYKRIVCENVAKHLCNKYSAFVSPSRKPYVYNFNRDVFIDFLGDLEIDFTKKDVDKEIIQLLSGLNYLGKDFVKKNNIECPKKCHFHNFYLFYLEKPFIKSKIEQELNK